MNTYVSLYREEKLEIIYVQQTVARKGDSALSFFNLHNLPGSCISVLGSCLWDSLGALISTSLITRTCFEVKASWAARKKTHQSSSTMRPNHLKSYLQVTHEGLLVSLGSVQQIFSLVEGASVWPGSGVEGGIWAMSRDATPE